MAEIKLTKELLEDLSRRAKLLEAGNKDKAQEGLEELKKKIGIPPEITPLGSECGGCVSCGACPIVHIKAGYLITATLLTP